jgi:hypothetical protein
MTDGNYNDKCNNNNNNKWQLRNAIRVRELYNDRVQKRREFFFLIVLKRRKENVMYVNDDYVIVVVNIYKSSLTMEEPLPTIGILEKLTREGKSLAFYTIVNKVETLNKP